MNMKRDGLIDVVGNKVILNKEKLENLFMTQIHFT